MSYKLCVTSLHRIIRN